MTIVSDFSFWWPILQTTWDQDQTAAFNSNLTMIQRLNRSVFEY